MTDQQLKQAQEIKRAIANIDDELEKFGKSSSGFSVYLPAIGTLIEDVKKVFAAHRETLNKKFKEL